MFSSWEHALMRWIVYFKFVQSYVRTPLLLRKYATYYFLVNMFTSTAWELLLRPGGALVNMFTKARASITTTTRAGAVKGAPRAVIGPLARANGGQVVGHVRANKQGARVDCADPCAQKEKGR